MKLKRHMRIVAVILSALLTIAAAQYGPACGAMAAAQPQTDIAATIQEARLSVVGIAGKLSKKSKDYDEMYENIIMGSGFIYKSNGYIITNNHVIDECESIYVILSNKKVYEARVIGTDEASDIALIKIDKGLLRPVVFGDSASVLVSEPVMTIGMPVYFELQNSVGFGNVSGTNRGNTGFTDYYFIQTDIMSNPGNSGGPLMDMDGNVLGIIEGGYANYAGIVFCIPSNLIQHVASQLIRYGHVRRPDIGARIAQRLSADYGLPGNQGLYIVDMDADGPLAQAGGEAGDILLSIDGVGLYTYTEYVELLLNYSPGDTVEMTLLRESELIYAQLTFAEKE